MHYFPHDGAALGLAKQRYIPASLIVSNYTLRRPHEHRTERYFFDLGSGCRARCRAAALPILLSLFATLIPAFVVFVRKAGSNKLDNSDPKVRSRLIDVLRQLERQKSIAYWANVTDKLLVFSQFVIGGLLASSFVQDSLDGKIAGSLGVLVLFATLIHKHYRPDLRARGAERRVLVLSRIVRITKDELDLICGNAHDAKPQPPDIQKMRERISAVLNEVESSEFDERQGETTLLPDKPTEKR